MNIVEARANNKGIDFYINQKNITVSAKRNENGTIVVTREDQIKPPVTQDKRKTRLFSFVMAIVGAFGYEVLETMGNWKITVLGILAFAWFVILLNYCIRSLNPKNKQLFKYHAAEHKVLNYWDKYKETTLDCNKVMEMSSISFRCGTTVCAVVSLLITISTLGIVCIPWIILKIIWCVFSVVITSYLWVNGKCDFLQKMVIREPELEEVEVAVRGMYEYIKTKSEVT